MSDPVILVAGSEPQDLRAIAHKVSNGPERHGVDIMWVSPIGAIGIQRKQFPEDFTSSMEDGRLAKETGQSQSLAVRILLLEGRGVWSTDGKLLTRYGAPITRATHQSYLHSMSLAGWWISQVGSLKETIEFVHTTAAWSLKPTHKATTTRPGSPRPLWGKRGTWDFQSWVLQGFPGVGPEMAGKIIGHFAGLPLKWDVTKEQMLEVDGVGPKTIENLWDAL
jgi:ERCC4-type nuclease